MNNSFLLFGSSGHLLSCIDVIMSNKDNILGPINLGNPNEITILDLAQLIIKLSGTRSKIIKTDLPSDDPVRRKPDITKAKSNFNWEPVVSLEHGLIETIKYFKNII